MKIPKYTAICICLVLSTMAISAVKILGEAEEAKDDSAVAGINTRPATDDLLIRSIAFLRRHAKEKLTKELLSKVCADKTFSLIHRRRCLLQLVSLYASDWMRLGDFIELIDNGSFLGGDGQMNTVSYTSSDELTCEWGHETWLVAEVKLPEKDSTRIYLLVDGVISAEDFAHPPKALVNAMHDPNSPLLQLHIKRILFQPSDPVDELLLNY